MATDFNKEFIKFKELILKNNPHANIDLIKKLMTLAFSTIMDKREIQAKIILSIRLQWHLIYLI